MRWKQGAKRLWYSGLDQPPGGFDDLDEAAGQLEIAEPVRRQPFEVVEFVVQDDIVGRPARRERHDQVMAAAGCGGQYLAPAGKAHDLDSEPGFFIDLAMQRRMQGFAEFDPAPRQRIEALGRRARAPHQQDLVVAEDGSADRKLRMLRWNGGCFRHQCVMIYSTSPSEPPLMMPPAADTSGLTQPAACNASLARVESCWASRIASCTATRMAVMVPVILSNSARRPTSAVS